VSVCVLSDRVTNLYSLTDLFSRISLFLVVEIFREQDRLSLKRGRGNRKMEERGNGGTGERGNGRTGERGNGGTGNGERRTENGNGERGIFKMGNL